MGKSKRFVLAVGIAVMCLIMSACIMSGKKLTVVDKTTGLSVSISEDELSVVGEIPINDTMSLVVTEGE